jgi:myo-inositol 2-dehydrogenase / D-chiro-inositol 1-dehydrogenase
MRIGLIGLGRIGAFHARTLVRLPHVKELVVTDALPATARAVADEVAATVVDSPEELFALGVDGVVIASSTPTHADLLRAAVARGLPTFCEKPVAHGAEQAVELRDELAGSDVPVQIGFPRRFDAGYAVAREMAQSGALGYLHTVRSTAFDPAPPPSGYVAASGGIFHDSSVHDYDSIRWATGQDVVEVLAVGANQGVDYIEAAGDVESATTVLTLSGGTIALVSNGRSNGRGHDVRLELFGSQDSVCAGLDERLPLGSTDPGVSFPGGQPWDFFMDRFGEAFRAELGAPTEVVAGSKESPCTIHDGVEATLVAEAATRSRRERRSVSLDEIRLTQR